MRITTHEQFVKKVHEIYGDRYDLSHTLYAGTHRPVTLVCAHHGEFVVTPSNLYRGHACQKCGVANRVSGRRKGLESLLSDLAKAQPSLAFKKIADEYKNNKSVITAECPVHGEFKTKANTILSGYGCPKCGALSGGKKTRTQFSEFIKRAVETHGGKYIYVKDSYTKLTNKMRVVCPKHGGFLQKPSDHIHSEAGCPACRQDALRDSIVIKYDEFKNRIETLYNDKYTVIASTYINVSSNVDVVCKHHGAFTIRGTHLINGGSCPKCSARASKPQIEIAEMIERFGFTVELNRRLRSGLEIDVFVKEHNLGIEYNGLYYHTQRFRPKSSYHLNKAKCAGAEGIDLVQIFSDEFEFNWFSIQRLILNRLGLNHSFRIYARSCELQEFVSSNIANEFYDTHHVQGSPGYGEHIALTRENVIIAVMTFSKRMSGRKTAGAGEWELVRYATSDNVVGGASKLFAAFIKKHSPTRVVSFSDNRLFTGGMYEKLGFRKTNVYGPDYKYVSLDNKRRLHKSRFQHKHLKQLLGEKYDPAKTERENCEGAGYYRIYDCGLTKWVWQN